MRVFTHFFKNMYGTKQTLALPSPPHPACHGQLVGDTIKLFRLPGEGY